MRILLLFGAPGAGKGTIAQYLAENYDVCHFSVGNLLRNEVKSKTDIGVKIEAILGAGQLVSNDIVNEITMRNVEKALESDSLIILDGYPRTKNQAEVLDSMRNGSLRDEIRVLELSIDKETFLSRISQRRVCAKCGRTYGPQDKISVCSCGGELVKRKDDDESAVMTRWSSYEAETLPLSEYFADRLIKVSGDGTPEEVAHRVDNALAEFGLKRK